MNVLVGTGSVDLCVSCMPLTVSLVHVHTSQTFLSVNLGAYTLILFTEKKTFDLAWLILHLHHQLV